MSGILYSNIKKIAQRRDVFRNYFSKIPFQFSTLKVFPSVSCKNSLNFFLYNPSNVVREMHACASSKILCWRSVECSVDDFSPEALLEMEKSPFLQFVKGDFPIPILLTKSLF